MGKQQWGCIYKLTNKVNGKYYLGKTVHFKRRMSQHKRRRKKRKTYFYNAIAKYGWDNFQVEILIADVPEEDLNQLEMSYIDIHDSTNPKKGYNLTKGGDGISGFTHTDETKKKICMANKNHSADKGCISFIKKLKKWQVRSIHSQRKHIGYYSTKEKALRALKLFNKTGKKLEADISTRKKGTGTIILTRSNTYQVVCKRKHIGNFKTKELALQALNLFNTTGKIKESKRRKGGTGSIRFNKYKKYQCQYKRKYVGSFKTKELAEEALKQYIIKI